MYRYDLVELPDPEEYIKFLEVVLSDEKKYLLPGIGFLQGREISDLLGKSPDSADIVLSEEYTNEVVKINSLCQDCISMLDSVINRIFSGEGLSWHDHVVPLLDQVQVLVIEGGRFLMDDMLIQVLNNALKNMREKDIYAFADDLVRLERFWGSRAGMLAEDVLFLKDTKYIRWQIMNG